MPIMMAWMVARGKGAGALRVSAGELTSFMAAHHAPEPPGNSTRAAAGQLHSAAIRARAEMARIEIRRVA
jgi:hypothetical protein